MRCVLYFYLLLNMHLSFVHAERAFFPEEGVHMHWVESPGVSPYPQEPGTIQQHSNNDMLFGPRSIDERLDDWTDWVLSVLVTPIRIVFAHFWR